MAPSVLVGIALDLNFFVHQPAKPTHPQPPPHMLLGNIAKAFKLKTRIEPTIVPSVPIARTYVYSDGVTTIEDHLSGLRMTINTAEEGVSDDDEPQDTMEQATLSRIEEDWDEEEEVEELLEEEPEPEPAFPPSNGTEDTIAGINCEDDEEVSISSYRGSLPKIDAMVAPKVIAARRHEYDYKSPRWNSDRIIAIVLQLEYRSSKSCRGCGKGTPGQYRCRDCLGGRMLCRTCIVDAHQFTPFHHAEEWTGTCFDRVTLSSLGLEIQCGHHGRRCPNAQGMELNKIQIIDHSGSYPMNVRYCGCPDAPPVYEQLLLMSLFPATAERPRTAFTFAALKDVQTSIFAAKVSLWDWWNMVRRKTNNVQPVKVPVSKPPPARSSYG